MKFKRIVLTFLALATCILCASCSKDIKSSTTIIDSPTNASKIPQGSATYIESSPSASISADVKAGDTVIFGSYEQDNNVSNGKEAIEWQVLERNGNEILIISKYALDCQAYHSARATVTWETSTLRSWLNGVFLFNAFSIDDRAMIKLSSVKNDDNATYKIDGGNDTTDKVFVLSIDEAKKYFTSDESRRCAPTEYAKTKGASANAGSCWWWLRSPGGNSKYASHCYSDGSIYDRGYSANCSNYAVRPVITLDISGHIN